MKNGKWLLLAGLVIMMMTIGCEKQMGFVAPEAGGVRTADLPPLGICYNPSGSWFLYFTGTPSAYPGSEHLMSIGQDNGATGSYVMVWKDEVAGKMYAEFHMTGDWYIQEAHFDVATTKDGLAHNKQGNLVPGKFKGQTKNRIPYPQTTLVEVDWDGPWTDLFMAALCKVAQGTYDAGTGWTYFNWNTGCGGEGGNPFKTFKLPDFPVTMTGAKDQGSPRHYWDITLSGIGGPEQGYNVWDGHWNGWCAEVAVSWPGYGSVPLQVTLYNSLDPALPARLQNPGWDNVSWLINEYGGDNFTGWPTFVYDMTNVTWYLLGDQPKPTWEPAQTMATRAKTEGEGYIPHTGGYVAVICDPYPVVSQLVFIEVDP